LWHEPLRDSRAETGQTSVGKNVGSFATIWGLRRVVRSGPGG
jgi:hypothetical protein